MKYLFIIIIIFVNIHNSYSQPAKVIPKESLMLSNSHFCTYEIYQKNCYRPNGACLMKYHIVDAYWMSVKNKRIKIRYHIACGKKVIAGTHILQKRKCRKHCDNLLFTISCEKLPKISILENGLIVTGWNHIWPSKKDIKKLKALKGKKIH